MLNSFLICLKGLQRERITRVLKLGISQQLFSKFALKCTTHRVFIIPISYAMKHLLEHWVDILNSVIHSGMRYTKTV